MADPNPSPNPNPNPNQVPGWLMGAMGSCTEMTSDMRPADNSLLPGLPDTDVSIYANSNPSPNPNLNPKPSPNPSPHPSPHSNPNPNQVSTYSHLRLDSPVCIGESDTWDSGWNLTACYWLECISVLLLLAFFVREFYLTSRPLPYPNPYPNPHPHPNPIPNPNLPHEQIERGVRPFPHHHE